VTLLQTAAQLACADIYDPITPGKFEKIYRVGESVWGLARIDGQTVPLSDWSDK